MSWGIGKKTSPIPKSITPEQIILETSARPHFEELYSFTGIIFLTTMYYSSEKLLALLSRPEFNATFVINPKGGQGIAKRTHIHIHKLAAKIDEIALPTPTIISIHRSYYRHVLFGQRIRWG